MRASGDILAKIFSCITLTIFQNSSLSNFCWQLSTTALQQRKKEIKKGYCETRYHPLPHIQLSLSVVSESDHWARYLQQLAVATTGQYLDIALTTGQYGIHSPGGSFDLCHRWDTSYSKLGLHTRRRITINFDCYSTLDIG